MKRKRIIILVHDILGLIHSSVIALIACKFLSLYLADPLGSLSGPDYVILKNSMFFTIGYFILNFVFILFLEPYKKRIIRYAINHIISITIPFTLLLNQKFVNVIGSLSIMEISNMFFYIRSILWDLKIKRYDTTIMNIIYMGIYILCKLFVPYYMIYHLIRAYPIYMNGTMYMEMLSFLFAVIILNLLRFKKIT